METEQNPVRHRLFVGVDIAAATAMAAWQAAGGKVSRPVQIHAAGCLCTGRNQPTAADCGAPCTPRAVVAHLCCDAFALTYANVCPIMLLGGHRGALRDTDRPPAPRR